MLVGGHRYKIVVALHKITGNMTAFYLSNLIEVIKVTTKWSHKRNASVKFDLQRNHNISYCTFIFSFVHTSIFHPVNSPRTKRIMLHLTISLFVITILKTYEILNAEYSIFVLVYYTISFIYIGCFLWMI